ncbi:MAG: hypothetical protein AAFV53_10875 [Myxococcota bacterium]
MIGIGLMLSTALAEAPIHRTVPRGLPAIRIEAGQAEVFVRSATGAERSAVILTPQRWGSKCSVTYGGDRSEAVVQIQKDGASRALGCKTNIELIMAGDTAITLEMGMGDIHLWPVDGAVTVSMTSGTVEGEIGAMGATIAAEQAHVRLWGLRSPVDAQVKVGAIDLRYVEPLRGETVARNDLGPITVQIPEPAFVEATTKMGQLVNRMPAPDPGSAAGTLALSTRVGRIEVAQSQ